MRRIRAGTLLASLLLASALGAGSAGVSGCGGDMATPYPDATVVPDPDPDAPLGGRLYALLVSSSGSASTIHVIEVSSLDVVRTISVSGGALSAISPHRVTGLLHAGDPTVAAMRRFDPDAGTELPAFVMPAPLHDVEQSRRFVPGEDFVQTLAASSAHVLVISELGGVSSAFVGAGGAVQGIALSPGGSSAALANHREAGPGEVRGYDVSDTLLSFAWTIPLSDPLCASPQPDAVQFQGPSARAWDAGCDALHLLFPPSTDDVSALAHFQGDSVRPATAQHQLLVADLHPWALTSSGVHSTTATAPLPDDVPGDATAFAESYDGMLLWIVSEGSGTASAGVFDRRDETFTPGVHSFPAGWHVVQLVFVDRPARLLTASASARWGETVTLELQYGDLDGDPVWASLPFGPAGASLEGGLFRWESECRASASTESVVIRLRSGQLEIDHVLALEMEGSSLCSEDTSGAGCSSSSEDEEDDEGNGGGCTCACSTTSRRARGAGVPAVLLGATILAWRRRERAREES